MIILRQSLFTSAASFKPKFRARFRNGDFTYTQSKDPRNEALNHQAYVEVAEEPEFKNNPETRKIRQGMFSQCEVGLEEERSYALIPDLFKYGKNSGFKRVWQKNIGEARRGLADKITEVGVRKNQALLEASGKGFDIASTNLAAQTRRNPIDYRKMKGIVTNKNIKVMDNPKVGNNQGFTITNMPKFSKNIKSQVNNKSLQPAQITEIKRFERAVRGKDGLIVVTGNNRSPVTLSHEYGHNLNMPGTARKIRNLGESQMQAKPGSVMSTALGNAAILNEEVTASRKGIKELERITGRPATHEEKQMLNMAADTYKYNGKAKTWQKLADKLNIPSRRSESLNKFSGYTVKEQLAMPNKTRIGLNGVEYIARPGRARIPNEIYPTVNYTPTQYIK